MKEDLKASTAYYADHAENRIPKLQQAYLQRSHPLESHSTEVLQRSQGVRNKRVGGKMSALFRGQREDLRTAELAKRGAKPAISEQGTAILLYLRVVLLTQPSGLVSDDDCRFAVSVLNQYRWMRVENLEDGYHVSGTLYFDDIDSC